MQKQVQNQFDDAAKKSTDFFSSTRDVPVSFFDGTDGFGG
jgi:hypothetical protein